MAAHDCQVDKEERAFSCPEPCSKLHRYCTQCGKRQEKCFFASSDRTEPVPESYLPDVAVDLLTDALWRETHETACTNPMEWSLTRLRARNLLRVILPSVRATALTGAVTWFRSHGRRPDLGSLEAFATVERLNEVLDPKARRLGTDTLDEGWGSE